MSQAEPDHGLTSRVSRRAWVWLFLLGGLPAFGSLAALPFAPAAALPWVVLLIPPVAYAGYRIWRIDHPSGRARHEIGWRLGSIASYAIALGIVGVFVSAPGAVLLVGGILVVVATAIVAYSARLQRAIERQRPPVASTPEPGTPPES